MSIDEHIVVTGLIQPQTTENADHIHESSIWTKKGSISGYATGKFQLTGLVKAGKKKNPTHRDENRNTARSENIEDEVK